MKLIHLLALQTGTGLYPDWYDFINSMALGLKLAAFFVKLRDPLYQKLKMLKLESIKDSLNLTSLSLKL